MVSTNARRLRQFLLMVIGQEELGRRIKEAREDAGLTQSQLADLLGLKHPQSVSRYERGQTEVPAKRLRRIAEATGKPMVFFVDEPDASAADAPQLPAEALELLELIRVETERLADAAAALVHATSELRIERGGSGSRQQPAGRQ